MSKATVKKALVTAAKPKPTRKLKARANTQTKTAVPTKVIPTKVVLTNKSGEKPMPTKSTAYKKIEASFEPFMDYNKMVAGSMESSYNMMMDSFQNYAKLGIDSMQSGLKVRSPEDVVSYFETQQAMAQKASDMMISDTKSFSEMGVKMFHDMRSMYESGMKTSVSAATEAMKA